MIWPKRVQIKIKEYLAARRAAGKNVKMDYEFDRIDNLERIFEQRLKEKPESLKVRIHALYRVKNLENEEFYFYNVTKTCKNRLNQNAPSFSYEGYGFHHKLVVTMQWNETSQKGEPTVTAYKQGFELKWDKQEVKKLLDSSDIPCTNFIVGKVGFGTNPIDEHPYQILNVEDFLNGGFEELMDLGRLGLSYPEPSIYMIMQPEKKNAKIEKRVSE